MAPKERKNKGQRASHAHYACHLQVLHVDNSTACPSVLLHFTSERYLFNAGEGAQRMLREYKKKISKIDKFFTTRASTETLGGLPGTLLSRVPIGQSDAAVLLGAPVISADLCGPPGTQAYSEAFRQYAGTVSVQVTEAGAGTVDPVIQTDVVNIRALLLQPAQQPAAAAAVAAVEGGPDAAEPATKRPRLQGPDADAVAIAGRSAPAVAYLCQLATVPGKFDPKKAAQLGVARGPLFGELQRGKPVMSVSGVLVKPDDVMEPAIPGATLLLLDCPTAAHFQAAAAHPLITQLIQHAQAKGQQQQVDAAAAKGSSSGTTAAAAGGPRKSLVMVHLGPRHVINNSSYQQWLQQQLGAPWQHVIAPADGLGSGVVTRRAAGHQAKLSLVDPQMFSIKGFLEMQQMQQGEQQQEQQGEQQQDQQQENGHEPRQQEGQQQAEGQGEGRQDQQQQGEEGNCGEGVTRIAKHMSKLVLTPLKYRGWDDGEVPGALDLQQLAADALHNGAGALEELKAKREEVERQGLPEQLRGLNGESFAVTLLGTCSSCPSHLRNVSSYYVDLFTRGSGLMDCGEDTMGQMERCFGPAEAARRIREIRFVWISHMHADHHGGLYSLLLRREQLLLQQQQEQGGPANGTAAAGGDPLLILGPWPLFRVLQTYSKVLPLRFTFLSNNHIQDPKRWPLPQQVTAAYQSVKAQLGLKELLPFPVDHVAHSFGCKLVGEAGWKLVFSGDTRPCQSVIAAAKDATLLVHEATFDDDLLAEAQAKKHSTVSEALQVAAAAGAYRTLLTHFSTRYPKLEVLTTAGTAAPAAVGGEGSGDGERAAGAGWELSKVAVGFDLMTVNAMDLTWLPAMVPVVDKLCKGDEAEEEEEAD